MVSIVLCPTTLHLQNNFIMLSQLNAGPNSGRVMESPMLTIDKNLPIHPLMHCFSTCVPPHGGFRSVPRNFLRNISPLMRELFFLENYFLGSKFKKSGRSVPRLSKKSQNVPKAEKG